MGIQSSILDCLSYMVFRCKVVYFIRHAEAFHNIAEREHELGSLYLQEVLEHGWCALLNLL